MHARSHACMHARTLLRVHFRVRSMKVIASEIVLRLRKRLLVRRCKNTIGRVYATEYFCAQRNADALRQWKQARVVGRDGKCKHASRWFKLRPKSGLTKSDFAMRCSFLNCKCTLRERNFKSYNESFREKKYAISIVDDFKNFPRSRDLRTSDKN